MQSNFGMDLFKTHGASSKHSDAIKLNAIPDYQRYILFILYTTVTFFVIHKIYRFNQSKSEFFIKIRDPNWSIFFMLIILGYCMYGIFMNATVLSTYSIVVYLIFNSLFISSILHILSSLFFAVIQQYTVLHSLENGGDAIQRLLLRLIVLSTSYKYAHENMTRSIWIVYNLAIFTAIILLNELTSLCIVYQYIIIITPQLFILNICIFIMYHKIPGPSDYGDLFHIYKQWKCICKRIVIPLNMMLISIYIFPAYFYCVSTWFILYLSFKFIWSVATYPLHLEFMRIQEILKVSTPERWSQFLNEDLLNNDRGDFDYFNVSIEEAIEHINQKFNHSMNNNNNNQNHQNGLHELHQVSEYKLELFLRYLGQDPSTNKQSCLYEFCFVTEMIQFKRFIITQTQQKYNVDITNHCGLLVEIPANLPRSSTLIQLEDKVKNGQQILDIDVIYEFLGEAYLKYINYDSATIKLFQRCDMKQIDDIYQLLTTEYPSRMCLKSPFNSTDTNMESIAFSGGAGAEHAKDFIIADPAQQQQEQEEEQEEIVSALSSFLEFANLNSTHSAGGGRGGGADLSINYSNYSRGNPSSSYYNDDISDTVKIDMFTQSLFSGGGGGFDGGDGGDGGGNYSYSCSTPLVDAGEGEYNGYIGYNVCKDNETETVAPENQHNEDNLVLNYENNKVNTDFSSSPFQIVGAHDDDDDDEDEPFTADIADFTKRLFGGSNIDVDIDGVKEDGLAASDFKYIAGEELQEKEEEDEEEREEEELAESELMRYTSTSTSTSTLQQEQDGDDKDKLHDNNDYGQFQLAEITEMDSFNGIDSLSLPLNNICCLLKCYDEILEGAAGRIQQSYDWYVDKVIHDKLKKCKSMI